MLNSIIFLLFTSDACLQNFFPNQYKISAEAAQKFIHYSNPPPIQQQISAATGTASNQTSPSNISFRVPLSTTHCIGNDKSLTDHQETSASSGSNTNSNNKIVSSSRDFNVIAYQTPHTSQPLKPILKNSAKKQLSIVDEQRADVFVVGVSGGQGDQADEKDAILPGEEKKNQAYRCFQSHVWYLKIVFFILIWKNNQIKFFLSFSLASIVFIKYFEFMSANDIAFVYYLTNIWKNFPFFLKIS